MEDKSLQKDKMLFNMEREIMKFMGAAQKHGLTDLIQPIIDKPILKIDNNNKITSHKAETVQGSKVEVCTCPIKIGKSKGKKNKREYKRFFIGGTNNNGYIINCPLHGKRTSMS